MDIDFVIPLRIVSSYLLLAVSQRTTIFEYYYLPKYRSSCHTVGGHSKQSAFPSLSVIFVESASSLVAEVPCSDSQESRVDSVFCS